MKEAELRKAIRDKARQEYGCLVFDTSQSRPQGKHLAGLPDLLIWGPGRFLSLEVKQEGGKLRDSQWDFIEDVKPLCGEHVQHALIDCIEQAEVWLDWVAPGEEEPF